MDTSENLAMDEKTNILTVHLSIKVLNSVCVKDVNIHHIGLRTLKPFRMFWFGIVIGSVGCVSTRSYM